MARARRACFWRAGFARSPVKTLSKILFKIGSTTINYRPPRNRGFTRSYDRVPDHLIGQIQQCPRRKKPFYKKVSAKSAKVINEKKGGNNMFAPLPVKVFATTGSDILAEKICGALQSRLPFDLQPGGRLILGKHIVERFSNDNIQVQVENVRGHFVVIVHTQVPPVNDRLFELFALLDAVINARPGDTLLVFPYMPYARSDRKNKPRISTMGHRLPHILTTSLEIERVILLDPHDSHIKHYFVPAADEISAIYLLADYLKREILFSKPKESSVIVFPDAGAAKRFEQISSLVRLPIAYLDKSRLDESEKPQINRVVGEVKDKLCILIDDEILTGGTAISDAEMLLNEGADSVYMVAVHAILAHKKLSDAELIQKLEKSPITRFIVTDSVPILHKLSDSTKFIVLPIAALLAEAIKRTVLGESLTELHKPETVPLYR